MSHGIAVYWLGQINFDEKKQTIKSILNFVFRAL